MGNENEVVVNGEENKPNLLQKWINFSCHIAFGVAMVLMLLLTLFTYATPVTVFGHGDSVSIFEAMFSKDGSFLTFIQDIIEDPESIISGVMDDSVGFILKMMAVVYGMMISAAVLIGLLVVTIKSIIDAVRKDFDKLPGNCGLMMVFSFMPCTYSVIFGDYAVVGHGTFAVGDGLIAGLAIALAVQLGTIALKTIFNFGRIRREIGLLKYIQPAIKLASLFIVFIIAATSPISETMAAVWRNFFSEYGIIQMMSGDSGPMIFMIEYLLLGVMLIALFTLVTNCTAIFRYYSSIENAQSDKVNRKISRKASPIGTIVLSVIGIVLSILVANSDYNVYGYDYNYVVPFVLSLVVAAIALAGCIVLNKFSGKKSETKAVETNEENKPTEENK